jgi:cytochrome c biogenesis protein
VTGPHQRAHPHHREQAARTTDTPSTPAENQEFSSAPPDPGDHPATGSHPGPLGWLRWLWRTLTSMRTALILLLLLSIAAIPGSLVPQAASQPSLAAAFRADHPTLAPIYDTLGLFSVYSSPWFAAVYLLLFISLGGCILPRCAQFIRSLRAKPPAAPKRLDRMPASREWATAAPPEEALEKAAGALRRRRFRLRVEELGGTQAAGTVSGEKGYLREVGNLLFHLALFGLLAAFAVGGLFGTTGQSIVIEGHSFTNTRTQYDDFRPGKLVSGDDLPPFTIHLEDFSGTYQRGGPQRGTPTSFKAKVRYTKTRGGPQHETTIRVNHPLEIDGSKVYLVAHGYAPEVTVRDGSGKVAWSGPVTFLPQDAFIRSTGVVKVPDATDSAGRRTQLAFTGLFLPTVRLTDKGWSSRYPGAEDPVLVLTAYHGQLALETGVPQNVYQLDTSNLTQFTTPDGSPFAKALRPGDRMTLPDGEGSLTFNGIKEWASFQVAANPSNDTALWSAVLAGLGLTASLFVRRRRLWVRVHPAAGFGSRVEVAGLDRSGTERLAEEATELADELRNLLPEVDSPAYAGSPRSTP